MQQARCVALSRFRIVVLPHRAPRVLPSAGFTVLEVLIVIAILGILAAVILPNGQPNAYERLQGAAQVVAMELAYGQSLAMANNSTYRFTIDPAHNRLVLEHSGTNAALNTLPASPFCSPNDPPNQHIIGLADSPQVGTDVVLLAATTGNTSAQRVDRVEFGSLGATTSSSPTTLWLAIGTGGSRRYITVEINPVTGLATIGPCSGEGPPSSVASDF